MERLTALKNWSAPWHRRRDPNSFWLSLGCVCDSLPLPEAMPGAQIGLARRLDLVSEIRALASRWQNCLRDYIPSVNSGRCAIYLFGTMRRHLLRVWSGAMVGLAGSWMTSKGQRTQRSIRQSLEVIHQSFVEAKVPHASMIEAVEQLYEEQDEPEL